MLIPTRRTAEGLDADDSLGKFRERFLLSEEILYLDGNSLGALPRATVDRLDKVITQEWGRDLIRSWNVNGWLDLPRQVGGKIARLVGAAPHEILVADSTSVNLFKLLAGALGIRPDRRVILSESDNFPTDLYIAQGLIQLLGKHHRLRTEPAGQIAEAIDGETAVVLLTQVNYRTGALHDMASLTTHARAHGALVLWDLAHSTGVLPVDLARCGVELAVGCGYKYLNGGPGAPAFLYVAEALQEELRTPLSGWLGHVDPFAFEADYRPAPGLGRFLCGTPGILGLAALECGVDLALEANIDQVRWKSMALGDFFIALVEEAGLDLALVSPRDARHRGSQVCFRHPHGHALMQAAIARGLLGDFRAPDILRFGFAPLYNRFVDIWEAVAILGEVMEAAN